MVMSIINNIGLAVTGCKNGYAVFSAAGGACSDPLEVQTALRDMRSYMRVTEPGRVYYSMEYTDRSVVYSIYRSSIDSVGSTGAYIGVHLFVPYDYGVCSVRRVLTILSDAYWSAYMHPMFGSPLSGKVEDTGPLVALLSAMEGEFYPLRARYARRSSNLERSPVYIPFASDSDVDRVMGNPCHAAYYDAARVILVSADMLEHPEQNHTVFNTPVNRVLPQHGRAEGLLGSLVVPPGSGVRLTALSADGCDLLASGEDFSLGPDTAISYELKVPGRRVARFTGTVRQALERGMIRKNGSSYEVKPTIVEVYARPSAPVREGCLPVLIDQSGKEYRIQNLPGGHVGWLVLSDGFPYALGVRSGQGTDRVKENFVTMSTVSSVPFPVDMAELSRHAEAVRPPSLAGAGDEILVEDNSRRTMFIVGAVVAFLLLAGALYWFWIRDDKSVSATMEKQASLYPDSTVLTVAPELLPGEGTKWTRLDTGTLPEGAGYDYRPGSPLRIVLRNRLWKEGDRVLSDSLPINFVDASGRVVHTLRLQRGMVDSIDNMLLFPKNTIAAFSVRPVADIVEKRELINEVMNDRPAVSGPVDAVVQETGDNTLPDAEPESPTPTGKKAELEKIRRVVPTEEVTRMIKELGSDPGKESIQRAEQMLKHVDKGQIPRLTTALKQAKQKLRAGQAKARTTNRGSGNARPE